MEIFDEATMPKLRRKSEALTAFLEAELRALPQGACEIVTPSDPGSRGCQLSLKVKDGRGLVEKLGKAGVICDFREPDVLRFAPVPLITTYDECDRAAAALAAQLR
jgi:kynureninase